LEDDEQTASEAHVTEIEGHCRAILGAPSDETKQGIRVACDMSP